MGLCRLRGHWVLTDSPARTDVVLFPHRTVVLFPHRTVVLFPHRTVVLIILRAVDLAAAAAAEQRVRVNDCAAIGGRGG